MYSVIMSLKPGMFNWTILLSVQLYFGLVSVGVAVQYKLNQEDVVYQCSKVHSLDGISSIFFLNDNNNEEETSPCVCVIDNPQIVSSINTNGDNHLLLTVKNVTCISESSDTLASQDACTWFVVDTVSGEQRDEGITVMVDWSETRRSLVLTADMFTREYSLPVIVDLGPQGVTYSVTCGPSGAFTSNLVTTKPQSASPRSTVLLAIMLTLGVGFFLSILTLVIFIICRRRHRKQKQAAIAGQQNHYRFTDNVRVNSYDHVIQAYGNENEAYNGNGSESDMIGKYLDVTRTESTEVLESNIEQKHHQTLELQIQDKRPQQASYTRDFNQFNIDPSDRIMAGSATNRQMQQNLGTSESLSGHNSQENINNQHKHATSNHISNNTTIYDVPHLPAQTSVETEKNTHKQKTMNHFEIFRGSDAHNMRPRYSNMTEPHSLAHNMDIPRKRDEESQEIIQKEYEKPSIDIYQVPAGYGTLRASKSVEQEDDQGPHYANVWVTKSGTRARSFNTGDSKPSLYADIDTAKLKKKQPSIKYSYSQEDDNNNMDNKIQPDGKFLNYVDLELGGTGRRPRRHQSGRRSAHSRQVKLTPEEVAELYAVPSKIRRRGSGKDSNAKIGGSISTGKLTDSNLQGSRTKETGNRESRTADENINGKEGEGRQQVKDKQNPQIPAYDHIGHPQVKDYGRMEGTQVLYNIQRFAPEGLDQGNNNHSIPVSKELVTKQVQLASKSSSNYNHSDRFNDGVHADVIGLAQHKTHSNNYLGSRQRNHREPSTYGQSGNSERQHIAVIEQTHQRDGHRPSHRLSNNNETDHKHMPNMGYHKSQSGLPKDLNNRQLESDLKQVGYTHNKIPRDRNRLPEAERQGNVHQNGRRHNSTTNPYESDSVKQHNVKPSQADTRSPIPAYAMYI